MKTTALALILVLSSAAQAATYTYIDEDRQQNSFDIVDLNIVWTTSEGSSFPLEEVVKSADSFEGKVLGDLGDSLLDLNFSLSFGPSFVTILKMLKYEKFRKGFEYLPESCPVGTKGFVMITENQTSKIRGHCLLILDQ
jgi:hypothetical protein